MHKTASLKYQLKCYLSLLSHKPSPTSQKFIIFGRGRSGSTALVSLLDCLPAIQCDGEILSESVLWPGSYIKAHVARANKLIYGCKILSYQLRDLHNIGQESDFLYQLTQSGFQILYLKRDNLLEHAISNIRARSFGFHRRKLMGKPCGLKILVDPRLVVDWIKKSECLQKYEASLLRNTPHLSLTYEKHLVNESDHQSTIDAICDYFSIPSQPVLSQYQKVSPRTLQDSVENYDELVDYLVSTPYIRYLPLEAACH